MNKFFFLNSIKLEEQYKLDFGVLKSNHHQQYIDLITQMNQTFFKKIKSKTNKSKKITWKNLYKIIDKTKSELLVSKLIFGFAERKFRKLHQHSKIKQLSLTKLVNIYISQCKNFLIHNNHKNIMNHTQMSFLKDITGTTIGNVGNDKQKISEVIQTKFKIHQENKKNLEKLFPLNIFIMKRKEQIFEKNEKFEIFHGKYVRSFILKNINDPQCSILPNKKGLEGIKGNVVNHVFGKNIFKTERLEENNLRQCLTQQSTHKGSYLLTENPSKSKVLEYAKSRNYNNGLRSNTISQFQRKTQDKTTVPKSFRFKSFLKTNDFYYK